MRLGINLLCATGHVRAADFGLFDLAREAGFEHVELPALSGSPDDFARAAARLDAVGLTRGCTAVCTPDADPDTLSAILDRTADAHEPGGRRFVRGVRQVSLSVGGGCYPVTATSAPAVLRQAHALMARATAQGGNRLVLPREL